MDKQTAKKMFSSCDFAGNYKFYKTVKKKLKENEFICMGFSDILISSHGNVFEFSYFNKINLYEVDYLIPKDIDVMFIKSLRDTMKIVNMLKSLKKHCILENDKKKVKSQETQKDKKRMRETQVIQNDKKRMLEITEAAK